MATPNENNRLQVRGRLVRDPNYSRKTGPEATAAFFTLAASRPYLDATGDMKTATDYVEVKVFEPELVAELEAAGLGKGAMVVVRGRAMAEVDSYEREGERVTRARLIAVVDGGESHEVRIEALGRSTAPAAPDDIPA